MDRHAQLEIRAYAEVIGRRIVAKWCPLVWEAFVDYRLEAKRFSRIEILVLKEILSGDKERATEVARELGLLRYKGGALVRNREREELEEKIAFLGEVAPWTRNAVGD